MTRKRSYAEQKKHFTDQLRHVFLWCIHLFQSSKTALCGKPYKAYHLPKTLAYSYTPHEMRSREVHHPHFWNVINNLSILDNKTKAAGQPRRRIGLHEQII